MWINSISGKRFPNGKVSCIFSPFSKKVLEKGVHLIISVVLYLGEYGSVFSGW